MIRNFEEICRSNKIANQLRNNDLSLTALDLRGGRPVNNIDDEEMEILIKELSKNTYLSDLILAENEITSNGLKFIESLQNIKYLDLSSNYLTDEGLQCFRKMKNLQFLNLGGLTNSFSGQALNYIFQECPNLETLIVSGIPEKTIIAEKIPKKLRLYVDQKIICGLENVEGSPEENLVNSLSFFVSEKKRTQASF